MQNASASSLQDKGFRNLTTLEFVVYGYIPVLRIRKPTFVSEAGKARLTYKRGLHPVVYSSSHDGLQSQDFAAVGREILALKPENRVPLVRSFQACRIAAPGRHFFNKPFGSPLKASY